MSRSILAAECLATDRRPMSLLRLFLPVACVAVLGCGDDDVATLEPRTPAFVGPIDWPQFRGPGLNNVTPENLIDPEKLVDGIEPEWEADIGVGYSSVAVADGWVWAYGFTPDEPPEVTEAFPGRDHMTGGDTGTASIRLCRIEPVVDGAVTGRPAFARGYPADRGRDTHHAGGTSSTPTVSGPVGPVADALVEVIDKQSRYVAMNLHSEAISGDARLRDRVDLPQFADAEPAQWGGAGSVVRLDGDRPASVVAAAGRLMLVGPDAGEPVLLGEPHRPGYSTPTPFELLDPENPGVPPRRFLAHYFSDGLAVVNLETNAEAAFAKFKTNTFDTAAASPVVRIENGGTTAAILVTAGLGTGASLFDFDGAGLSRRYFTKELSCHFMTPVLVGGHLYGCDGHSAFPRTAELVCLDWATGEAVWKERGLGLTSLVVAGGYLVILNDTGTLRIARSSPEGYEELASAEVLDGQCWTCPVVSHGRVFARNTTGRLVCLDLRPDAAKEYMRSLKSPGG